MKEPKKLENQLTKVERNFQEEIKSIKLKHESDMKQVRDSNSKANEIARGELVELFEKGQGLLKSEIEGIRRSTLTSAMTNKITPKSKEAKIVNFENVDYGKAKVVAAEKKTKNDFVVKHTPTNNKKEAPAAPEGGLNKH